MKILEKPVDGRISQYFGENPSSYTKFGLLGHNGIDYAIPVGTKVRACAEGKVIEIANDSTGYGLYIKMSHWWGESIYGHLSSTLVSVNQQVGSQQNIALSGDTGNSTGPHLHFGIRITPYSRKDGWNGHSDPQPYLEDKDNTYIIGPHIINGPSKFYEELRKLQPAIALVLDPNKEEMIRLKEICPNTKIIGRIFKDDSAVASLIKTSPTEAARAMHNAVISHPAFGHIDYWQGWVNEVCQVDWEEFNKLVQCELERMKLATTYKCAIFAFSVGNPDMPATDKMAYWKKTYPALEYAEKNGHIVCLHQYGAAPNIWGPENRGGPDWLIHRLEHQVLPEIPFKKLKFAVTEFGHDYLIVSGPPSDGGYKKRENYKNNYRAYSEDLINIGKYLSKYEGRILGYAVFTLGHNSPWESYDIAGSVLNDLANATQSVPVNIIGNITEAVNAKQVINVNPKAALTKVALWLDLPTQVTQEIEITINDKVYVAAKFENMETGASYILYCERGQWDQVEQIKLK